MLMNSKQRTVLTQIIASCGCKAAQSLSSITGQETNFTPPTVMLMTPGQACDEIATGAVGWGCSVKIEFKGVISGTAYIAYNADQATDLAKDFADQFGLEECDETDTLTEFANILLNIYLGTLSNALGANLTFQPPTFEVDLQAEFVLPDEARGVDTVLLGISTSLLLNNRSHQASVVILLGVPSIVVLSAVAARCELGSFASV